jgi:hypothetical protein
MSATKIVLLVLLLPVTIAAIVYLSNENDRREHEEYLIQKQLRENEYRLCLDDLKAKKIPFKDWGKYCGANATAKPPSTPATRN